MRSGGETVVSWNLALDESGGPHQGLCGTRCNGVVETKNDGTVTRNADPDASRAVYAVNTGSAEKIFSVTDAGRSFTYTLPAGAVATFTWKP